MAIFSSGLGVGVGVGDITINLIETVTLIMDQNDEVIFLKNEDKELILDTMADGLEITC